MATKCPRNLSTESTRPDLAVQTSMSQQCFPTPGVQDLLQANQAVRRARQQSDLNIHAPYIPVESLKNLPCVFGLMQPLPIVLN